MWRWRKECSRPALDVVFHSPSFVIACYEIALYRIGPLPAVPSFPIGCLFLVMPSRWRLLFLLLGLQRGRDGQTGFQWMDCQVGMRYERFDDRVNWVVAPALVAFSLASLDHRRMCLALFRHGFMLMCCFMVFIMTPLHLHKWLFSWMS